MKTFSAHQRPDTLAQLAHETYDLLVIGGGITGAGIALDAASRGLKTALIEMQDFAAGTSSRSTKLIHGGLRYLKQLEVGLVMETGREREVLHRNAPHLVVPEKMLLPLIKDGTYGPLATSFGLWVYDVLAGVKDSEQRVMLTKEQTLAQEPLLREDILEGGGLYIEYRTDDARLTIEAMKTAVNLGATCLNYVKAIGFSYNERGKIEATEVQDLLGSQTFAIRARKTVNAAGPWVDTVREKDHSAPNSNKHLHLTKGVHVVLPYERFPARQALYFDVPDGRMIFAIPRQGITYLGTTDTTYQGDIAQPQTTEADVDYLLRSANWMFPSLGLSPADVISSWAGLRPLIHEDGKSPSELSRKDEIFISEGGLISIAGGKLTGYRKMAARVVDKVIRKLHKRYGIAEMESSTQQMALCGGDFGGSAQAVRTLVGSLTWQAAQLGLDAQYAEFLGFNFGSNAPLVLAQVSQLLPNAPNVQVAALWAELHYCFEYEQIQTVADFLIRRTGRLYFQRTQLAALVAPAASELARLLGGGTELADQLVQDFDRDYHAVLQFTASPTFVPATTAG
jgi:glycerol-3-phosphate dehydrogenase